MEQVPVDGTSVPAVGLGTWRLTGERCRRAVDTALDLGYRHIDTAQDYGNEREIGQAIADADIEREEMFLTTKVWVRNARYDDVLESTHRSLDRLGTDYVDLLLLHWPNPLVPIGETLAAMGKLRDDGHIRHAGMSNFSLDRLRSARETTDVPVAADQVQLNPYRPRPDLRQYCAEEGVLLVAYSPLGHGGLIHDPVLREIGERYGKSAPQVAIRWTIQHEGIATIPRATSPEHQRENADVFDFELSEEEIRRIERPSGLRTAVSWARGWLGV